MFQNEALFQAHGAIVAANEKYQRATTRKALDQAHDEREVAIGAYRSAEDIARREDYARRLREVSQQEQAADG